MRIPCQPLWALLWVLRCWGVECGCGTRAMRVAKRGRLRGPPIKCL